MVSNVNLNDIYIFHAVSELNSITAASKQLNSSKQTISRKLAQLEAALGVTLIARNSRYFQLTSAGQAYYQHCCQIIQQIELANAQVQAHQTALEGNIKISLPHDCNSKAICNYLMTFMEKHPRIKLDINVCDRNSFALGDGFDLAIRLGELEDSSLVARRLGTINYGLVASPCYLKKISPPQTADDLARHTYIMVSKSSGNTGRDSPLQQCRQLVVNEFILAKQFASQGFGLVHLPLFMCYDELQSGELATLPLAECRETKTLSLVFPKDKYMPGYVRRFIDYLVDMCRDRELWLVDHDQYLYQSPTLKQRRTGQG
ncbi:MULTISPECIES: LysR family transcriptional regulator [unclassified Cellvibrio]|uniref:LysR family transcriptional regulator n=1 Tax=unclassified Cellvibrio TaxID=2624793 RepID=UPI00066FEB2A|nr:LysR family transcriptional regulator [Cellvibrio sp. pealriver]